jgi:hypothetical protein
VFRFASLTLPQRLVQLSLRHVMLRLVAEHLSEEQKDLTAAQLLHAHCLDLTTEALPFSALVRLSPDRRSA